MLMNLRKRFDPARFLFVARRQNVSRARLALVVCCLTLLALSNCAPATEEDFTVNRNATGTTNNGNGAGGNSTANLTALTPEIINAPIQTTDGRTIRLADYAGKVVVLDLWATWCAPCREEIPHLVDIKREYGERGLEIIGIGVDPRENAQMLDSFARQFNVNYPIGLPEQIIGPAMTRERGGVIPQTYIITRDGRILMRFVGFNPTRSAPQLRAAVERAVNTP